MFISKQMFQSDNGLFFKNKEEMMTKYYKDVLNLDYKKEILEPKKNFYEKLFKIENQREQMEFYMNNNGFGMDTTIHEISLMQHFQQHSIYANVTLDLLDALKSFIGNKKVLEVCSGAGFLARGLLDKGVNITATDLHPRIESFCEVEGLDAIEAVKKYADEIDYVLLTWSPLYDSIDWEVLKVIRKINKTRTADKEIKMIVIGKLFGCTNSEVFSEKSIKLQNDKFDDVIASYDSYYAIKDRPYLIK